MNYFDMLDARKARSANMPFPPMPASAQQCEWIHCSPPICVDGVIDVWMDDGSVKQSRIVKSVDFSTLFFVGQMHPLSNAICDRSRVRAWRPSK